MILAIIAVISFDLGLLVGDRLHQHWLLGRARRKLTTMERTQLRYLLELLKRRR